MKFLILAAFAIASCWAACNPDKPKVCPFIYAPVCATFKKTFTNQCVLEASLCQLAIDGLEYTEQVVDGDCCERACTKELDYTCGTDGVTHDNPCKMSVARCENKDWIEATTSDNCPGFPGGNP